MRILIRYSDNTVQAAMLLATIGSRVRAAVPGCDDAVEFIWTRQRWQAEDGGAVEIEFDAAANSAEWSEACEAAASMHRADGAEPPTQYWPAREPAGTFPAHSN
jgi:hypothetical protein